MPASASITAVCIRCGASKKRAPARCENCEFTPSSTTDLAKSFILSRTFDIAERSIGRSPTELAQISSAIAGGSPYQFSDAEVNAVAREVAAFRAITSGRLAMDLAKWLGPPLLILAIVYALLQFT